MSSVDIPQKKLMADSIYDTVSSRLKTIVLLYFYDTDHEIRFPREEVLSHDLI